MTEQYETLLLAGTFHNEKKLLFGSAMLKFPKDKLEYVTQEIRKSGLDRLICLDLYQKDEAYLQDVCNYVSSRLGIPVEIYPVQEIVCLEASAEPA